MSMQSWKQEFYPVRAIECANNGNNTDLIKHSLLKWSGLVKENIDKHELRLSPHMSLIDDFDLDGWATMHMDSSTCALCQEYSNSDNCQGCPIVELQGYRCDKPNASSFSINSSAWGAWERNGDPQPMIDLLTRCLNKATEKQS